MKLEGILGAPYGCADNCAEDGHMGPNGKHTSACRDINHGYQNGSRQTLANVVRWLKGECPHMVGKNMDGYDIPPFSASRFECELCMAQLEKLAEENKP